MGPRVELEGLVNGRRLRNCSDEAHLYYPLFLMACNAYARMELKYEWFYDKVLRAFRSPLSEESYWAIVKEFLDQKLLYAYIVDNHHYAQFDCKATCLPRYQGEKDKEIPGPTDQREYQHWLDDIRGRTKGVPAFLQKKNFGENTDFDEKIAESAQKTVFSLVKRSEETKSGEKKSEEKSKTTTTYSVASTPFEWPESLKAARESRPETDEALIDRIARETLLKEPRARDCHIAQAIRETAKGKKQTSGGWWISVAPTFVARNIEAWLEIDAIAENDCLRCNNTERVVRRTLVEPNAHETGDAWAERLLRIPESERYEPCPDCAARRREPTRAAPRMGVQRATAREVA